jgi:hypothetical protein
MKRLIFWPVVAFFAVMASGVHADVVVTLQPSASPIELNGVDDPFALDIVISNPDGDEVRSWVLDLYYDPAVFEPIAFVAGAYIPGVIGQQNLSFNDDGVNPDIAKVSVLNFGSGSSTAANGVLGTITLDAVGVSPGSTLFAAGDSKVLTQGGATLPSTFQDAVVEVNVPEPGMAMGGLVLMGLLARRRNRIA